MSDRRLEQEVLRALFVEPRIDPTGVFVAVRRGVVTLTGSVDSYSEKRLAKPAVELVPGVKSVVDKLTVKGLPPIGPGDREGHVLARVLNTLYWDLAVPQDRISVSYQNGVVVLTGVVDRPYQKSAAEADVRNISEVRGVRNEIVVDSTPTSH